MLKKAGIVVAVTVAGVFALSPLAFADDFTNIESGNLSNDCAFSQTGPDIDSTVTGGDAFLGAGGAVINAIAPVSAPVQAGNCTNVNVSDVVDNNSNNVDETRIRTEIEDSFNESFEADDDGPFGPGFPFED
ncbi:hypothetical protein [Pseudonocardia humida]|uniref:Uncharacterized protein n=1 Tax=Pseudonocardia humida TaxID=2800819 RepID=A0ABT1AAF9_9PSEU|nr:hypothetical protein [Pseudonocardia humida]MCO1660046.1 hypothetical protein [Pseudonocardia humida]